MPEWLSSITGLFRREDFVAVLIVVLIFILIPDQYLPVGLVSFRTEYYSWLSFALLVSSVFTVCLAIEFLVNFYRQWAKAKAKKRKAEGQLLEWRQEFSGLSSQHRAIIFEIYLNKIVAKKVDPEDETINLLLCLDYLSEVSNFYWDERLYTCVCNVGLTYKARRLMDRFGDSLYEEYEREQKTR